MPSKKLSHPKKILLIDDDQYILESISLLLEEEGYTVITLPEGQELRQSLNSYPVDLIITDAWLPGPKGIEIAKELKNHKKSKGIPILLISAHDNIFRDEETKYVDGFAKKPFDIPSFLNTVKRLLRL